MANIQALLDKMTSSDKDLRFMACSDLITELKKPDFKINERVERKVGLKQDPPKWCSPFLACCAAPYPARGYQRRSAESRCEVVRLFFML